MKFLVLSNVALPEGTRDLRGETKTTAESHRFTAFGTDEDVKRTKKQVSISI
jgi:hypothetical protein